MKLDLFYEKNKWYAVTIAPDDHYQFFGKERRLERFVNLFNEKFLCYTPNKIDYIFHIELSEPHVKKETTKDGRIIDKSIMGEGPRLHMHGKILFKNDLAIRYWLMYGMHNLLIHTSLTIKPIEDTEIWDKYCTKQAHVIRHPPLENILTWEP